MAELGAKPFTSITALKPPWVYFTKEETEA